MKFIPNKNPDAVPSMIRKILEDASADQIRIAVAFWGNGAVESLRLNEFINGNRNWSLAKVVCNLRTGGSNPSEVERLVNVFSSINVKVYTNDFFACKGLVYK